MVYNQPMNLPQIHLETGLSEKTSVMVYWIRVLELPFGKEFWSGITEKTSRVGLLDKTF